MPAGFYVHRAKLLAFFRMSHPVLEPVLLLLIIHRKPILYEDDARANQHFFEEGARSQELLIFLLCAEAHDALNAGAVVPAPVEENDLTGRGQFRHISLKIPLPALPLGRSGEGDDAADAGVQRICNALDDATLARCIPPLEEGAHLETVVPHIFLQLNQFDLEVYEFFDVVVILRGFAWFRSVTHDPVLLDFCGLPRQLHHFAARVLVFVLLLHVDPPVLIAMAGRLSSRVTDKIRRLRRLLRGSTSAACGIEEMEL